jgi:hypothetical protein
VKCSLSKDTAPREREREGERERERERVRERERGRARERERESGRDAWFSVSKERPQPYAICTRLVSLRIVGQPD